MARISSSPAMDRRWRGIPSSPATARSRQRGPRRGRRQEGGGVDLGGGSRHHEDSSYSQVLYYPSRSHRLLPQPAGLSDIFPVMVSNSAVFDEMLRRNHSAISDIVLCFVGSAILTYPCSEMPCHLSTVCVSHFPYYYYFIARCALYISTAFAKKTRLFPAEAA